MYSITGYLFRLFWLVSFFVFSFGVNAGYLHVQKTLFEFTNDDVRGFGCSYCSGFDDVTMQDRNGLFVCGQCADKLTSIYRKFKLNNRHSGNDEYVKGEINKNFPNNPEVESKINVLLEKENRKQYQRSSVFCCSASLERDEFLSFNAPDQKYLNLTCSDCKQLVQYKELNSHASNHMVTCQCGYQPSGQLSMKQRFDKLKEHQKTRKKCSFCYRTVPCAEKRDHEFVCGCKPVECSVCKMSMTSEELVTHVTEMSCLPDHQNISCAICRTTLPALSYAGHVKQSHNAEYALASLSAEDCPYCSDIEGSVSEKELLTHVANQHTEEYVKLAGMSSDDIKDDDEQFFILRSRMQTAENHFNLSQMYSVAVAAVKKNVMQPVFDDASGRLSKEIAILKRYISDLELQLLVTQISTHNGALLWRIPDVKRRIGNAKNKRVTSIYSPPFFSGRNGYKMCIRLYLNGDGMWQKKCLSIYFVLMKGEFDPLLKWPFRQKVSFVLIDQQPGDKEHIVQTFKPTELSSSFERPKTDMNAGSGCPAFCQLDKLQDERYVKDDVMYVKCIVDTRSLVDP